ncbi:hypothetical protein Gotur_019566 [Gossypium turneri]
MSLSGNCLPPVGVGWEDDLLDPCEVKEDVFPVQKASFRGYVMWWETYWFQCFIKSNTPIQLMDLENVYYFVKCKDEQDYTKALMEGP